MDKKTTSIVAYITWIGWIVAYCAGDKEGAKFHLNQSLVIWLGSIALFVARYILIFIPIIGWLASLAASVFLIVIWVMGLIAAINQEEKPVPLVGNIKIIK